ncbi:polysaccharide pyruvyl transferase family protein [Bacteroidota bacterium]
MNIGHIFAHAANNTGDIYLKQAVQMSFHNIFPQAIFHNVEIRKIYDESDIKALNNYDLLIIGGGGLLLRDTFPNDVSDWQWGCSVELLNSIKTPIIVYAIGYNRFRMQDNFNTAVFNKHIQTLIDKSLFFSVRNSGSKAALKEYISEDQYRKINLNFCPSILYPQLVMDRKHNSGKIGFMLAGDRINLRHPDLPGFIEKVKSLLSRVSSEHDLYIVGHQPNDFWYLDELKGIPFQKIELIGLQPKDAIAFYTGMDVMIGDRGHSQMIPFGLGCKIISLISHDKLRWFLDDINMNEYGIEENDADLVDKVLAIISDKTDVYGNKRIEALRKISKTHFLNLDTIYEKVMSAL